LAASAASARIDTWLAAAAAAVVAAAARKGE
jgi:hypothetical protein